MDNLHRPRGSGIAGSLKAQMANAARGQANSLTPTAADARRAVEHSRRLFNRTLSAWVCDLLALRRAGLDRPHWTAQRHDDQWNEAA